MSGLRLQISGSSSYSLDGEMNIQYERASDSDKDMFRALSEACYVDVVTLQFGAWDSELQNQNFDLKWQGQQFQKIMVDGKFAGGIWVDGHPEYRQLRELQVHPDYQGKGVGTAVIKAFLMDSDAKQIPTRLRVLHLNRALALYRRLGFETIEKTQTQFVMERLPDS